MTTREEVMKLAEECGISVGGHAGSPYPTKKQLARFYRAATLQAAERMKEEAAKVCDEKHWDDNRLFADAIRAIDVKEIFK